MRMDNIQMLEHTEFVLGEGDGQDGYNVVKIKPNRVVEYTFFVWDAKNRRQVWHRTTFSISKEELAGLHEVLFKLRVLELDKEYDANVVDGTQVFVKIKGDGFRKRIYCNNYFPKEIQRIRDYVPAEHYCFSFCGDCDRQGDYASPKPT